MYRAEVHRTVGDVELLEKLDLDMRITEQAYRSEHSVTGELTVETTPDDGVVRDRRAVPKGLLGNATAGLGGGDDDATAFPGTGLYVGLGRDTPLTQDDDAFQENYLVDVIDVDGIPENGVVEFDADWDLAEAEQFLASGETRIFTETYDVDGLPGDQLPLIVRANLYRDAVAIAEKVDDDARHGGASVQQYEGLAALAIELEHRDLAGGGVLNVDAFRVDMSSTFPQIRFEPQDGATYNPEASRVEWSTVHLAPGESTGFFILGPIRELLAIDSLSASMRARSTGRTLSGMTLSGLYDESGSQIPRSDDQRLSHAVTVLGSVEIDPSALRGDAQQVSNATITVDTTPEQLYQRLRQVATSNGIHIQDSDDVGEADPVAGRDGVFEIVEGEGDGVGDAGWLKVRREYGDRGVVYADMTVTGEFVAISEESEVSAFDRSEDRIVRADRGGLDTRGRSKVRIKARSAASELNNEFISTFERELGGEAR